MKSRMKEKHKIRGVFTVLYFLVLVYKLYKIIFTFYYDDFRCFEIPVKFDLYLDKFL